MTEEVTIEDKVLLYIRLLLASPFVGMVAACEGIADFILPKSVKLESKLKVESFSKQNAQGEKDN